MAVMWDVVRFRLRRPAPMFAAHDAKWRIAFRRRRQAMFDALFNPYRPELHYMRGPGPKWRAKHGKASG